MKCILLLFTLVALCYSYPYRGGYESRRNININEDGSIVITGADGKRIVINKGIGRSGQKTVDISVSGPNIPTKRVQINEESDIRVNGEDEYNNVDDEYLRDKRSSKDSKKQRGSQGDILTQILSKYQGGIDQTSYQQLLKEINAAVQSGRLSSSIYDLLQILDSEQEQGRLWENQQGILGNQRQADVLDLLRQQAVERDLQLQQEQQYQRLLQEQQGLRGLLPLRSQQTQLPYGLRSQSLWNSGRVSGVQNILDVPVRVGQQETIDRGILSQQQPISYLRGGRLIPGVRSWDVTGQQRIGDINSIIGSEPIIGRTLWNGSQRDLLSVNSAQSQSIPAQLSEVIEQERELLEQQRLIQQQQLQQQQQQPQQRLLQQQLLQQDLQQRQQQQLEQLPQQGQLLSQQQQQLQQQQQQQQLLQQLLQQNLQQRQQQQLEQLPQQGQLLQQQQPILWRNLLLNSGRPIQREVQQDLWQQQPGVYSLAGLYGGYGQDIPLVQRYNGPLIL